MLCFICGIGLQPILHFGNQKHPHAPIEGDDLIESQCYFSHYIQHILNTSRNVVAKSTILEPNQSHVTCLCSSPSQSAKKRKESQESLNQVYIP